MKPTNPALAALYASLYALGLSAFTVFSTAVGIGWTLGPTHGGFNDWPSFVTYLGNVWFGMVIGIVFQVGPYARAKQGYTAAANPGTTLPPPEQAVVESPQHS